MIRWQPTVLAISLLLVALVAVALGVDAYSSPEPASDPRAALAAAGCSLTIARDQGRRHVTALPRGFRYDTFPPTSGPHAPQPAIWGVYSSPVPELALVHNLEHGGIVVQYGTRVPRSSVARILEWYGRSPDALVVAPLPALRGEVALTAWTRLATCTHFDPRAFGAFRDAYRYRGPEQLPLGALQPGT
jgi:hypothetical protein